MTSIRPLAAALAVVALAVPAAQGQGAERHASVAESNHSATRRPLPGPPTWPVNPQPVTNTPAVDSATRRSQPGPPTWPVNPRPITSAAANQVTARDTGLHWTAIALGLAGSVLALSGLAAVAIRRSRRVQRARIPA